MESAPTSPTVREPVKLTPEQAQQLAREGLALRQEINRRFAKMRVLTEDDLRLLTR